MIQIYSGETGGNVLVPVDSTIPAVSGYAVFIGRNKLQYRLDGILQSGMLVIPKLYISKFIPGDYLMYAQVIDDINLVYFLIPEDIEIVYVPDFFVNGEFISTDSLVSNFNQHLTDYNNPHQTTAQQVGAEPALGLPAADGYILSSTTTGIRSWIPNTGGGNGSDAYYHHIQSLPAAVWTITHNLGKKPSVEVIDSAGDNWFGVVAYLSDNQLTITFSAAFSGDAYLN